MRKHLEDDYLALARSEREHNKPPVEFDNAVVCSKCRLPCTQHEEGWYCQTCQAWRVRRSAGFQGKFEMR